MISSQKTVSIQYFAILREARGCSDETLSTSATTAEKLYKELQERYGFNLSTDVMRVVINDEFKDWDTPIKANDTIVFIPPVAGG